MNRNHAVQEFPRPPRNVQNAWSMRLSKAWVAMARPGGGAPIFFASPFRGFCRKSLGDVSGQASRSGSAGVNRMTCPLRGSVLRRRRPPAPHRRCRRAASRTGRCTGGGPTRSRPGCVSFPRRASSRNRSGTMWSLHLSEANAERKKARLRVLLPLREEWSPRMEVPERQVTGASPA